MPAEQLSRTAQAQAQVHEIVRQVLESGPDEYPTEEDREVVGLKNVLHLLDQLHGTLGNPTPEALRCFTGIRAAVQQMIREHMGYKE